jgi:hypothetical protein
MACKAIKFGTLIILFCLTAAMYFGHLKCDQKKKIELVYLRYLYDVYRTYVDRFSVKHKWSVGKYVLLFG